MRPRDEQLLVEIGELPFNVAVFDERGIRSCVDYADASMRDTMVDALTNPLGIKELIHRVFRRSRDVSDVLQRPGEELVAIVRYAVRDVAATADSLVASLVAILRAVCEPSPVVVTADAGPSPSFVPQR